MTIRSWPSLMLVAVVPFFAASCGSDDSSGSPLPGEEGGRPDTKEAELSVYDMRRDCGRAVWKRALGNVWGTEERPTLTGEDEVWDKPQFNISVSADLWNMGSTQMDPDSKNPICQAVREFITPGMGKWDSDIPTFLQLKRGDFFYFDPQFAFVFSDPLPRKLSELSKEQLEGKALVALRKVEARFTPGIARSKAGGQESVSFSDESVVADFECEKPFQYKYELALRDLNETHVLAKDLCRDAALSPGMKECLRVSVVPGDKCKFRAKKAFFIKADASRVRATIGGTLERSGEKAYLLRVSNVELP